MFIAAVLLPIVVAGIAFIGYQWRHARDAAMARVQEHARTVQRAVDRELALDLAVLNALATSRDIDASDWRTFDDAARQAARARPGSWFVLYDHAGQTLVNTSVPFGTPLPNFRKLASVSTDVEWNGRRLPLPGAWLFAPFDTGQPSFSGIFFGPVNRRPVVASTVPVLRAKHARYVLAVAYSSQFFENVLQAESRPGEITALYDQSGSFIARNLESEKYVGREGAATFRNPTAIDQEVVGEATNVQGTRVVYARIRSAVAPGYVISASVPRATVLGPAWRSLWSWLGVLSAAAAIATWFAVRLWRGVGTPLAALARQARSAGEQRDEGPSTAIDEVEALRDALRARSRAERAVRDAEQHYRTLAENAPEVIARFDRELRHTYVNEYGATVYGVPARDVIGKTNADLGMPAEKVAFWNRHFEDVLATGKQVTVDFDFESATFGKQYFSSIFVPERDANGEVTSILAITRDVTERHRLERELRAAYERLRESDQRKNEFLGMLSHELRNPLAPIRSSVYVLKRTTPGSEQAARARAVIERQTEHLTRLIDDLLDVTRIERGKIILHRDRVDLRELVRRAAEDARLVLDKKDVVLRVELPAARLWADADATRITQVLGNLLANARKFTRPGDEILVTVREVNATAEISVRDTGAGIDPELLPNLFDPFVQGKRTLARSEGGLGLGLALVRGLVELHGGNVRAFSEGQGRGAEFVVTLPLVGPLIDEQVHDRPSPRTSAARRVLVVDDNADAAESLAELVGLFGHQVEVAFDGPSAIEKARQHRPDIVLCDIGLPGMSGYEVAKALRAEQDGNVRLVAVSGYAQPEDVSKATEAGFDAHLAKPADPEKVAAMLV